MLITKCSRHMVLYVQKLIPLSLSHWKMYFSDVLCNFAQSETTVKQHSIIRLPISSIPRSFLVNNIFLGVS